MTSDIDQALLKVVLTNAKHLADIGFQGILLIGKDILDAYPIDLSNDRGHFIADQLAGIAQTVNQYPDHSGDELEEHYADFF